MGLVWSGGAPEGSRARLAQERNAAAYDLRRTAYASSLSTHRPRPSSSSKRTTASATPRRLGILEDEALFHQVLVIIQRGVVKIEIALGIDENTRAIFFEHFVAVARFRIQTHRVAETGTAAALHADAESAGFGRYAFFLQQLTNFNGSFFGYMNHGRFPTCVRAAHFSPCAAQQQTDGGLVMRRGGFGRLYVRFALLLLPVAQCGLDRVFCQHRTVNLHR